MDPILIAQIFSTSASATNTTGTTTTTSSTNQQQPQTQDQVTEKKPSTTDRAIDSEFILFAFVFRIFGLWSLPLPIIVRFSTYAQQSRNQIQCHQSNVIPRKSKSPQRFGHCY